MRTSNYSTLVFTEETVTQQSNAHTQYSLSPLPPSTVWILPLTTGLCFGLSRRHILRDRRPCTTSSVFPAWWSMGTHKVKKCAVRKKKYFVLFWPEQPWQDKNRLYRHDEPNEPTTERPLHLYSVSPHLSRFQQSAGATPLPSLHVLYAEVGVAPMSSARRYSAT
jgi:hypothetical protein